MKKENIYDELLLLMAKKYFLNICDFSILAILNDSITEKNMN